MTEPNPLVARSDAERQLARKRYRFYRERGCAITDHDLAAAP